MGWLCGVKKKAATYSHPYISDRQTIGLMEKNEVEEQGQSSRDELLAGLKKHAVELRRLGIEIATLNKALELKKRALHQLQGLMLDKQARISLSQEEKRELLTLATSYDVTSAPSYDKWLEFDLQLQAVGTEDVDCFFDQPQNLQVTILYKDRPSLTVDLVDSVRKDPNNIGHPLVVMALRRYAKHLSPTGKSASKRKAAPDVPERMKPEVAKNNIDRIIRALIAGVGANQPIPLEETYLSVMTFVRKFPPDYFEMLWSILREASVKDALRGGTKIARVKRKLLDKYPDFDHSLTLSYLQSVFNGKAAMKLPKRGGGEALRNAFLGWKYAVEPKSAKEYLSKGQRWLDALVSKGNPASSAEKPIGFSDKEIDEITVEAMFNLLGVAKIPPYESISTLVTVKTP